MCIRFLDVNRYAFLLCIILISHTAEVTALSYLEVNKRGQGQIDVFSLNFPYYLIHCFLLKARSVYNYIPTAVLVAASCCGNGSTRGFDEMVPHHVSYRSKICFA